MGDFNWSNGTAYQAFMGRWSRLVAQQFLAWLDVPHGQRWLDVGCGSGTLCRLILDEYQPQQITGVDSSAGFVAFARQTIDHPAAHFQVMDAQALQLEDGAVDTAVSGLMLNFVPDPEQALREMARVTSRGGCVGAFVWDYAEGMQFLRIFWDAAIEQNPASVIYDEGPLFPICQPGGLEEAARQAGLQQVEGRAIIIQTRFQDFDDYWQPFLGGVGVGPRYVMGLSLEKREQLRQIVQQRLPVAPDGSISLTARAWAVKARG